MGKGVKFVSESHRLPYIFLLITRMDTMLVKSVLHVFVSQIENISMPLLVFTSVGSG